MSDNKILAQWSSPARPYKERTREFYTTILSLAFLLGIILLLLKEFLLIGVIMAFAFLSYVLATHRPDNVTHQITEAGIITDNKLYKWEELTQYWVTKQWDQEVIMVKTQKSIPGLLVMVLNSSHKTPILKAFEGKIVDEKPADSFVDRASRWLTDKIPLESK